MNRPDAILANTGFARCLGTLCVKRVSFPTYPVLARAAQIAGKVFLEFSVESGVAIDIAVDGHPLLAAAAEWQTVRQTRARVGY